MGKIPNWTLLEIVPSDITKTDKTLEMFLTRNYQSGITFRKLNEEELWEEFDIEQLISSQDFVKRSLIVLGKIPTPPINSPILSTDNIAFPQG